MARSAGPTKKINSPKFPHFALEGKGTLPDHVASWLRDAIFSGCFLPGQRLTQAHISSLLGVSMTPVREAMRELASEGLLTFSPRRGISVSSLSIEEAAEMRMLGGLLERKCGELVALRMTAEELAQARAMAREIADTRDMHRYFLGNRRFHYFLYETARSPEVARMLRRIHNRTLAYLPAVFRRLEDRHRQGLEEHEAFLAACERRDADRAGEIMFRHWDVMFRELEEIVTEAEDRPATAVPHRVARRRFA